MQKQNKILRNEATQPFNTMLIVTVVFAILKGPGPWNQFGPASSLDFSLHGGVAHFIASKPDNNDRPYRFRTECWALNVVPELKKKSMAHLWRTGDLSRRDMEAFITSYFHHSLHANALATLKMAIPWAEQYCLDPLWVASMIFVESNFSTSRRSSKNAFGALQIIPETGRLISRKLFGVEDPGLSSILVKTPETNIRMGLFYFARLINFFSRNYEHATVAYNMGPWWVKDKLKLGPYRARGHNYFVKIHSQYVGLMQEYLDWVLNTPAEYEGTYVFMGRSENGLEQLALGYAREVESFLAYIDQIMGTERKTFLAENEQ
ncbi:MAG: transglycosylase SLT domain-containing protein [Bdellovibrio sp.]|nr:transglycosylase SLT domain-containing protein [Bdellovibrio sp.]